MSGFHIHSLPKWRGASSYAAQPGIESTGKEKLKKAKHHVFILFWFVGKAQTHIHWLQYFWASVQFFGDCKCSWCFIIGFSEECLVFGYFKALVQWWISKELENHKWHFEVWFIYWISSFRDSNELDSLTFWWDASSTDRNPDFISFCPFNKIQLVYGLYISPRAVLCFHIVYIVCQM